MKFKKVKIGDKQLTLVLANTFFSRMIGLAFKKRPKADGMLFTFPFRRRWSLWMLGMKYAIYIIWVDRGRVLGVELVEKPRTFREVFRLHTAPLPVQYAIEIPRTHFKTLPLRTDSPWVRNFGGGNPLPTAFGGGSLPQLPKGSLPFAAGFEVGPK